MSKYSFENYKVDLNNAQAYKMAKAMEENLEESANLLYIYGKSGTGKTHILYAIEKFIRENNPEWNVVRISTVDSVNDVIDVIRTGNNGKMKE